MRLSHLQSRVDLGTAAGAVEVENDKEKLYQYFHLASVHNLRFILRLMEQARQAILDGTFESFKEQFLDRYYHRNSHRDA